MNYILLFLLGTLWGIAPLLAKITVTEVPVLTLVAGRVVLAAAIMWIILKVRGMSMPSRIGPWFFYAVMGLFNVAIPFSLITWAVQSIPGGLAALLQATTPIFTVILANFLVGDERFSLARFAGVMVGFFGVAIQMLPSLRAGQHASLWGQLVVILASVCFAGTAIFSRKYMRNQPPMVATTGLLTMSGLFLVPPSILLERPFHLSLSPPVIAAWLSLAVFGSVVGHIIYFMIVARAGATFLTMITYIMPVAAILFGALTLNEPLSPSLIASLALILLSVFLVRRRSVPGCSP